MDSFRIKPAGDSALLIEVGEEINPQTSRRVHALAARLAQKPLPGLGEAVPGYASLLLHFDPLIIPGDQIQQWVASILEERLDAQAPPPGRSLEIPTLYDGPDLASLAAAKHLAIDEVIRLHAGREYLVYLVGFTPGFAYLGEVDERIAAPRLATPRKSVPAGSVGIAGRQTGVYPIESPGGWQLIGRTNLVFFNPLADPPCLLAPGDRVTFRPVEHLP